MRQDRSRRAFTNEADQIQICHLKKKGWIVLIENFADMFNAQMSSHTECRAEKSNFWREKKKN